MYDGEHFKQKNNRKIQLLCYQEAYQLQLQMHADDFRTNRHGVVSDLRDGGYSDDMTLAAIAGDIFMPLNLKLI